MASHRLVTTKELAYLPRSKAHPTLEVQFVVDTIVPTRAAEFEPDTLVFNISGLDVVSKQRVHAYFYNEWATAASFVNIGDTATVKGFVVFDAPQRRPKVLAEGLEPLSVSQGESPVSSSWCYVTPIGGNDTAFAVAQPAEQGDVIEITARPPTFEPTAKVLAQRPLGGMTLASGTGKIVDAN